MVLSVGIRLVLVGGFIGHLIPRERARAVVGDTKPVGSVFKRNFIERASKSRCRKIPYLKKSSYTARSRDTDPALKSQRGTGIARCHSPSVSIEVRGTDWHANLVLTDSSHSSTA